MLIAGIGEELDSYKQLLSGWSGDDSEPPTDETIALAHQFLVEMCVADKSGLQPAVAPCGSGEILFEWTDLDIGVWIHGVDRFTISFGSHELQFKAPRSTALLCAALLMEATA